MDSNLFLQTTTDLNDVHMNIKDVVYVGGIIITLLTAWFKLKHDNDKQTDKIKALQNTADKYYAECKEEFMNAKNGRISIRRDTDDKFQRLETDIKANKESVNSEIKEITQSINKVKSDTAEIKGMISTLLNKK